MIPKFTLLIKLAKVLSVLAPSLETRTYRVDFGLLRDRIKFFKKGLGRRRGGTAKPHICLRFK
jgi:hypothetical protein